MRKMVLYTAATLDGYIAGPTGEIDWLESADRPGEDYGYSTFIETIDTTLMGTATYRLAISFEGGNPYPGKANYVFTRQSPPPPDTDDWHFVTGDIASFARDLKAQDGLGIWLVGGGQINTVMLNAGLIDEMVVTLFPLVLGKGIPLFAPGADLSPFRTLSAQTYESGLVQWTLAKA